MQKYQEMMKQTFDNIVQIGAGGGGTVFKAYHKRLGIDVVLKKIHTNKMNTINRRAELDILKTLKNDYIPQIYDFIEYGDDVFTVMEYIPGESFAQLLAQKKKFSQKDVVKWMLQLCTVIDYLHSQKPAIIHCDIKPANIMLTPKGDICLIDFNISGMKTEDGIASIGYSNGYAPAEQFAVVAEYLERKVAAAPSKVVYQNKNDDLTDVDDETEVDDDVTDIDDETEVDDDVTDIDDETEVDDNVTDVDDETEVEEDVTSVTKKKEVGQHAAVSDSKLLLSGKSRMKSLSDEEWETAKRTAASIGKKLVVNEKTDIYSAGATMYHILTGVKPQPFYKDQVAIRSVYPRISEGLAYIIEKSMQPNPQKRFANSAELLKAAKNLGIIDKRYKALARNQRISFAVLMLCVVLSAGAAILGKDTMAKEKLEQYQDYIEAIQEARETLDYENAKEIYKEAVKLFPDMYEAYYQMAMTYYTIGEYDQCIVFLNEAVYANPDVVLDTSYDKFYYLTASCYFEREEYTTAITYYEMALKIKENELSYYRDYVVALARIGQVSAAEQVLQTAIEKNVAGDIISLLQGEIALIKKEYQTAEKALKDCIAATEDAYMKLRAYTKLDEVYGQLYQGADQYTIRITYLKEALTVLPAQYQITLMERLAQAYIDYSDIADKVVNCQNAISIFEEMENKGYATFTSKYNIAVLYEKIGDHSAAMKKLDAMLKEYPNNYNIYKRMAFVELNIQAGKENKDRDYHNFESHYQKAMKLYQEKANGDDVEMLSLQQLYNDVVANGWL